MAFLQVVVDNVGDFGELGMFLQVKKIIEGAIGSFDLPAISTLRFSSRPA